MHAGAFGPGRPSSAPRSLSIVCEVIEGAGPHQPPGNRSRDGKAERPGTAERLNGDPKDLIRAIPAKGDHPAGRFFRAAIGLARLSRAERDTGRRVGRLPYRGRLRTAVMERIIWNDFRIGLRVVPGPGRAGRETRSTSKVAKRRPAGRTADDAHAVLAGLAQAQREGQGSRS